MTTTTPVSPTMDARQQDRLIKTLMSCAGVKDSFVNFAGETQLIPEQDQLAVLQALGYNTNAPGNAIEELANSVWMTLLPPVAVFSRHQNGQISAGVLLHISEQNARRTMSWKIITEQGQYSATVQFDLAALELRGSQSIDGVLYQARWLPLNLQTLADGYHLLELECLSHEHPSVSMPLILAPARCYEPEWSVSGKRRWGLSVQLYSLCSDRSWGMGDFADLMQLIKLSADKGASFLVLNPLHTGGLHQPEHCSPYSPVDRRRLNPLYIAPELEPEFSGSKASNWLKKNTQAKQLLNQARNSEWIDYPSVSQLKMQVLALMFEDFIAQTSDNNRLQAFFQFKQEQGESLQQYADWQAQYPPEQIAQTGADSEFYIYLQWLAESQLAACQQQAIDAGMAPGLIRDLAVGSARSGAEVSLSDGAFSVSANIGAPPDPLAPQGQNWGLPPLNPKVLREQAYSHFISLLRSNMAHSGALRIDHVMSLMRLWWCPYKDSGHGAYVMYPADDLFAILRLESQRQQCMVIGEDLGIVPTEVRRHLSESGIYSNLLFYFEKSCPDSFRSPEHYPARALSMLANHDVPTLAAWWNGSDLILRRTLELIPDDNELATQLGMRQAEKKQILQLLESQWLLPANRFGQDQVSLEMDHSLAAALMRCIARSNSLLVSVQLEDLVLEETPVNIPGTCSEYKNWRRKLPVDLFQQLRTESVAQMLDSLRMERA